MTEALCDPKGLPPGRGSPFHGSGSSTLVHKRHLVHGFTTTLLNQSFKNIHRRLLYGGPKGSITNRFTKTQNNFPKHKSISQNTKQFPKAQISFPKHKSISQNTNQFLKTRSSLPKHKPISQNTNQFRETQINGLGTFPVIIRESLERTHSQDFRRPTW